MAVRWALDRPVTPHSMHPSDCHPCICSNMLMIEQHWHHKVCIICKFFLLRPQLKPQPRILQWTAKRALWGIPILKVDVIKHWWWWLLTLWTVTLNNNSSQSTAATYVNQLLASLQHLSDKSKEHSLWMSEVYKTKWSHHIWWTLKLSKSQS